MSEVELEGASEPQTDLSMMLNILQDAAAKHPKLAASEPFVHMVKILKEQGNEAEVARFIESYLSPDHPNPYHLAFQGMSTMFLLGYMYARGEAHMKSALVN